MFKYLRKHWPWLVLSPLFLLGEMAMTLWQPRMMTQIVDEGVLMGDMGLVVTVGGQMLLLVLFGGLCGVASGLSAHISGQLFGNDLRKDVFSHIMGLSFQQTDAFTTGSLVTRLTNDVTQLQNMVTFAARMLLHSLLLFVGGIAMMWQSSSGFSLVAAGLLPIVLGVSLVFLKKTAPLYDRVQDRLDAINVFLQEHIAATRVVKAYVSEEYEMGRFDNANDALCETNLQVQTLLAFMHPCMNILMNLGVVAVLYVGGYTIQNGSDVTPGQVMGAVTYMTMILGRVIFLSNIFQNFTRAAASWKRVKAVLVSDPTLADGGSLSPENITGRVEFRNVSFAFPDAPDRPVLRNVSFSVEQGGTLAIIGATGCGKTSLVSLIPRFYDVTAGTVLVNGLDVREWPQKDLRDRVATVFQTSQLYSRSIAENIAWGSPQADPWAIKKAAQIAQADDFICATEAGYHTQVTESGRSLSGGQKQRLAIARAVLRQPEVLILDDASSALDLRTEANLRSALRQELPNTTKIIVAQRIASVRHADHILVLENGAVSAVGTHDELLATSAVYRDICASQLKGGEQDD